MQVTSPVLRYLKHQSLKGEKSYKEVVHRNRWTRLEPTIVPEQKTLMVFPHFNDTGLLQRYLVVSFPDWDEIPTRNDVRRCPQLTLKDVFYLQVFDLNKWNCIIDFNFWCKEENVEDADQL